MYVKDKEPIWIFSQLLSLLLCHVNFYNTLALYFGHVMSKACQYVTNKTKVGVAMKEINLKDAKIDLQKTIT